MNTFIGRKKNRNLMRVLSGLSFAVLVPAVLLTVSGNSVFAGGLVDTSIERFELADFSNSASIDNPWWTLTAGTNRLYFAETDDGCAWNLVEVLRKTTDEFVGKTYAGIQARIVLDREWVDEECNEWDPDVRSYAQFIDDFDLELEEATYDWYAQDEEMNIWYMGEDTMDAEGSSEGSFIAGCDGAEAGIVMLGDPEKGDFYQQEFYEGEAEDWGKVLNFVELDDMECLKIKEWTPLENGHIEHKYYCGGELVLIEELREKTVIVELIGENVYAPRAPRRPPNPRPDCMY